MIKCTTLTPIVSGSKTGAPPPGGGPPDDDDSSDLPHAPRPSLPRPSLPHNNDGSGYPGGLGGGPPDGGDDGGGGDYGHLPDWGDNHNQGSHNSNAPAMQNKLKPYFDTKLRPELVPEWDGTPDTLFQWILKVNYISQHSLTVFNQLGQIIPLRLCKNAEKWFFSLSMASRAKGSL